MSFKPLPGHVLNFVGLKALGVPFLGSFLPRPRVMLVEFLNSDPLYQHRVRDYPLIQGFVRSHGGHTHWVSLVAGREARPNHPFVVEPDDATCRLLVDAAVAYRPTHLAFNERLGDAFHDMVAAAVPSARLIQPPDKYLDREFIRSAVPDYHQVRLDPQAETADHFVSIVLEPQCLYYKTVRGNPFFEGIDTDGLPYAFGCTFCTKDKPRKTRLTPARAVEKVLNQFGRYYKTVPTGLRRDRFRLIVTPMLPRIGEFFAGLLDLDVPPSELHLSCRVDELLAMGDAFRQWLPRLAERGYSLHIWQIGLENFSPDENLRFNKGITIDQIEAAAKLLDDLERKWPQNFFFRCHGGFAMIVFTPWTRLEDLRINAREYRRLGLADRTTAVLSSRLQLRKGTPLLLLAERDGLTLADSVLQSSPFSSYSIRHWGEEEIPWRFQNDAVAAVYGAVVQLFPPDAFYGRRRISNLVRTLREKDHFLVKDQSRALEALVDAAESAPGASPDELIEQVAGNVGERRPFD